MWISWKSKNIYGSYRADGRTDRQTDVVNTFQLSLESVKIDYTLKFSKPCEHKTNYNLVIVRNKIIHLKGIKCLSVQNGDKLEQKVRGLYIVCYSKNDFFSRWQNSWFILQKF